METRSYKINEQQKCVNKPHFLFHQKSVFQLKYKADLVVTYCEQAKKYKN